MPIRQAKYGMYLAVLPVYRTRCIEILRQELGPGLQLWVSAAHLDKTVKTGIPRDWYKPTRMLRLANRIFIQYGSLAQALRATSLIVDLNPRSLTAWFLLASRRIIGRPTSVWGHLHGQSGSETTTAVLRRTMRRIATATIVYTYSSRADATAELPGRPVLVAANALYRAADIYPSLDTERTAVLYVGRFVREKKVDLLIRGFAAFSSQQPNVVLRLVGSGSEEAHLRKLVGELGIADKVEFRGWINDIEALRAEYSQAFVSVSPGFVGLQITQSMGFGVPVLTADKEPHSPEVELASSDPTAWFRSDVHTDLAAKLQDHYERRWMVPIQEMSDRVKTNYSAEKMADGLRLALSYGGHLA